MIRPALPSQVSPPEFARTDLSPYEVAEVDVIALAVLPGDDATSPLLGPGADQLSEILGLDLLEVVESERATGDAGQIISIPVGAGTADNPALRQVLLVGVGSQSPTDFRRAGAALARAVTDRSTVATTIAALDPETALEPFVVGTMLGSFAFHWRSEGPKHMPVRRVVLAGLPETDDGALRRAVSVGGAGWRSRMLATVPSNVKDPQWLAEQAVDLAAEAGLTCEVWDEDQLAAEGFGGVIGVGQGSDSPPRLIRLDYTPAKTTKATPTVVLVGKGITFDSGGLSIKPAEAMASMKRDMTGGAVVMSTMAALAAIDCPVKVIGLVPAAENSVSGNSTRPGDVLTHFGGRTSEVTNTDAEGRLVLADAMAYAAKVLKPDVIVDVATLTGGVKVALGQETGGLFANNDSLADALLAAGTVAGEPLWRLPLSSEYEANLASKVADADNGAGGPAAITAALFLQHFVDDVPWAHLDLASVGDVPEERHEWTAGPSGFGARLLLAWLGGADPMAGVTP